MSHKIQVRRGLQSDLPLLDEGEIGFSLDEKRTYIGSPTGNVELAKASDVADMAVNVKRFGAKGDGVTDDTAAIQAAINSVSVSSVKSIYFPKGHTFLVDMLRVVSNSKLFGGGTLKFKNDTTSFAALLVDEKENVVIDDIEFDCNVDGQTTWSESRHAIISYSSKHVTIQNCTFKNLIGDGIYLSHRPENTSPSADFKIVKNKFVGESKNRNGVSLIHAKDIMIDGNSFEGMARSTMPGAIDLEPNTATERVESVTITNNIIIGTNETVGVQNGISLANNYQNGAVIENVLIANNIIRGRWKYGVALFGDSSHLLTQASIKNNHIEIVESVAETSGVLISKGVYDVSENVINGTNDHAIKIVGGRFKINSNRLSNAKKYGIEEIGTTADFGTIHGNDIVDCGTIASNTYGGIHLTGDNLVITNNRIHTFDPNKTRMGIYLTAGKKNLISGNYFKGVGYRDMNINVGPQVFGQNVSHSATANVVLGTYPPTSETWTAGDMIIMPVTGAMYICTASGTPGTWRTI